MAALPTWPSTEPLPPPADPAWLRALERDRRGELRCEMRFDAGGGYPERVFPQPAASRALYLGTFAGLMLAAGAWIGRRNSL